MAHFTTFLGNKMSQAKGTIEFWENILVENDFKRFIEFGTYKGGLSLFFLLWSLTRKSEFRTYDTSVHKFNRLAYFLKLPKYFSRLNIFEHEEEIGEIISRPGLSIVYCDNGDKIEELKIFSKYLKKGDLIGVHDWGNEVLKDDIPENMEMVYSHGEKPDTIVLKKI